MKNNYILKILYELLALQLSLFPSNITEEKAHLFWKIEACQTFHKKL